MSSSLSLPTDHAERMQRARLSLDGLSVGDAFGQHFFVPNVEFLIGQRTIPFPRWQYTDDTEMALAIVDVLEAHGHIHQDELSRAFVQRYQRNPLRGYGATARQILEAVANGGPWRAASASAFGGEGSMGNGAAMRVAPLGAYFADDLDRAVKEAIASAEVTHGHPEGQAGAVAVASAAAFASRISAGLEKTKPGCLIELAIEHLEAGDTRNRLIQALALPLAESPVAAARLLGSGQRVTAPDTVPFTLWCASRHFDNYEEVLWNTVAGLGDRDTTCAIVGGIVALSAGRASIPEEWLRAREPLK